MTPGRMSGKVTFQNVVHSLAPRSMAASSRWRGKLASRAFTVTTTKLMLNMMWAIRTVRMFSGNSNALGQWQLDGGDEHGQQRGTEHDLRRRHRQEDQHVGRAATAKRVARQGQADHRPEGGRDQRRQRCDDEAVAHRGGQSRPTERVQPRVDREVAPRQVRPAGRIVEAEQDHDGDRQDEVRGHGDHVEGQQPAVDHPTEPRRPAPGGRRRPVSQSPPSDGRPGQLLGPEEPRVDEQADQDGRISTNDRADAVG